MGLSDVVETFRHEATAFSAAVGELSTAEQELPTRCPPWSVAELVGHVTVVLSWVPQMVAAPPPPSGAAVVSAVDYYRPDQRFSPESNAGRIELAGRRAARMRTSDALVSDVEAVWPEVDRACRGEPDGRLVRTRHGDVMLLSQFLVTRVVEVAVHGIDVADAVRREAWVTPQAVELLRALLLSHDAAAAVERFGWDGAGFLRKVTGREPLGPHEVEVLTRLGTHWLTLG